ncbi:MAG: AIR synthase family protein [Thermoplasmata archaeon]
MSLQSGKLPHRLLRRMIRYSGARDKSVILGPRIGEDAAAIDLGEDVLILKTDPISYTAKEIGWYAVNINANDIATMGARPKWMQTCLLVPQGMSTKEIEDIFRQVDRACRSLGIAVTGGHTEINPWLDRPIIVGDMHGICKKKDLVLSSGARAGDAIILTKGAGIEGTATLAREKKAHLLRKFSKALIRRAENYLYDPGISVVNEAMIGARLGATAMHDPTEGGVLVGLYEIAEASGKGLLVDADEIIVGKETEKLCEFFGLDPLGLLGSGALLVVLPRRKVDAYLDELRKEGVRGSEIGEMKHKNCGLKLISDGKTRPLRFSQRDEILKVL